MQIHCDNTFKGSTSSPSLSWVLLISLEFNLPYRQSRHCGTHCQLFVNGRALLTAPRIMTPKSPHALTKNPSHLWHRQQSLCIWIVTGHFPQLSTNYPAFIVIQNHDDWNTAGWGVRWTPTFDWLRYDCHHQWGHLHHYDPFHKLHDHLLFHRTDPWSLEKSSSSR